jgi:DNA replication factor GINS
MNLDELQSVQARERQSSDLQHLRSSFYREVGEYVQSLTEERDELVERADDPFSEPEVRQLTDDIETAEQTVEAIYERRVGKVVKKASIAAAGMPVDDDGLTEEEEALFEDLVGRIERNRETVLSVLDGETPDLTTTPGGPAASPPDEPGDAADRDSEAAADRSTADPDEPSPTSGASAAGEAETDPGGVSAADLMGDAPEGDASPGADDGSDAAGTPADPDDDPLAAGPDGGPTEVPPEPTPPGGAGPDADDDGEAEGESAETDAASREAAGRDAGTRRGEEPAADAASDDREIPGIPRTTVRITADVGEVVGADDRDYDLGPEDVVTLPEPNADVLIEKDAAERLE